MKRMRVPRLPQAKVVQLVSQLSGLTQLQVRTVIDDYLTVVHDACMNGFEVMAPSIGIFSIRYKPYRDPIITPNVTNGGKLTPSGVREEHNVPYFKVSPNFYAEMKEATWKNPVYKPDKYMEKGEDDEPEEEADIEQI